MEKIKELFSHKQNKGCISFGLNKALSGNS
ncbi:MAG: hypothetical protein ACJA2Y_001370 [Cycloclasticus pugetii]|jgi:hypothetical protein